MEEVSQDATGGRIIRSGEAFTVVSAEQRSLRLGFRLEIAHSLAARSHTDNVIVIVRADSGAIGYGECVPRDYVTGETSATVARTLNDLLPRLNGAVFDSPASVCSFLAAMVTPERLAANPAAFCALELALLDCAGRHWKLPLAELLGIPQAGEPLVYSMVVTLMNDVALTAMLRLTREAGFTQVKLKVDGDDPVKLTARARDILGDGIELRIDANCAWTRENAPGFLDGLADLGVVSVEQPLPPRDLDGLAGLRGTGVLITLDESVASLADVRKVARAGAADVLNIRISKCGGLLPSLAMIDAARSEGIGVQLGAQVGETSILSAAGAHLAAGTPFFHWREGCFGTHLLDRDISDTPLMFGLGGIVSPPDGWGLGITVDPGLIDELTARGATGSRGV